MICPECKHVHIPICTVTLAQLQCIRNVTPGPFIACLCPRCVHWYELSATRLIAELKM